MSVKISVIIPVYNVEKYLRECLDSVLGQTLSDIEVICVNDGSPDNSPAILKEYAEKDRRIIVIDKANEGVGKARNDGMKAASGEFIAFMDSDDWYPSPDVLEKLYLAAVGNCVSAVCGIRRKFYEDGSMKRETMPVEEYGVTFSASGVTEYKDYQYDYGFTLFLFERKLLLDNGIFFPPYKRFQDPPFFVRAMAAAERFCACEFDCYDYRVMSGETKSSIKSTLDFLRGITDNLCFSRERGFAKLHYLSALRLCSEGSYMAIRNVYSPERAQLLNLFITATAAVDTEWLKEQGFALPDPFVPELFEYLVSSAEKYEKIRTNKAVRTVSGLFRR